MAKRTVTAAVQNGVPPVVNGSLQEMRKESNVLPEILRLVACAGFGVLSGFAMEKSRVYVPAVIQDQMLFSRFTMLKVFLSAVTAGLGSFTILYLLPPTRKLFDTVRGDFYGCVNSKTIGAVVLGGALLGMGMTLTGACPGMVVLQLGAGIPNALVTLAGCFAGTILYGALEPVFRGSLFNKDYRSHDSVWLDRWLGVPFPTVALPLALFMGGIVLAIEYFVPWTTDVPVSPSTVGLLAQRSWSPILAGLLLGAFQLGTSFAVNDSLGGSTSYCVLLSQAAQTMRVQRLLPYFNHSAGGIRSWWQVAFWLGAGAGAGLSAYLSGSWGTMAGVPPLMGFIGGMSLLFGARMACGCTSGHGLSGMALLSAVSFIAVPAMFAGGIGLAVLRTVL